MKAMPNGFNTTDWITTKEAAELTGYRLSHLRHLVREKIIEGRKFGRDWMISRDSILSYAEKMEKLGSAKHDPWRAGARQRKSEV